MKININKLIFYLVILFPITTVLQGISVLENINRFMMFLLLGSLVVALLKKRILKKDIMIIAVTLVLYIFAFIFTQNQVNINVYFYYALWILYFLFITKNYNELIEFSNEHIGFIKKLMLLFNIIILISLGFSQSYKNGLFSPFACGEHRFGSCCTMITALNYLVVLNTRKKTDFKYSILPIIGICMCGARTYLAIYIVLFLCILYLNCKKKSTFYLMLIPLAICILLLIKISPVGQKIMSTATDGYNGFLATLTSGRSKFWYYDVKSFFDLNFLQQFVGNGFDFVYNVNMKYVKLNIWAHNDFINLLMNFGYIGLILYLKVLINFFKKATKNKKMHIIQKYSFYFIWFFNAFFNMVYTYTVSTLAIPFILHATCNDFYKDNKEMLGEGNENK